MLQCQNGKKNMLHTTHMNLCNVCRTNVHDFKGTRLLCTEPILLSHPALWTRLMAELALNTTLKQSNNATY